MVTRKCFEFNGKTMGRRARSGLDFQKCKQKKHPRRTWGTVNADHKVESKGKARIYKCRLKRTNKIGAYKKCLPPVWGKVMGSRGWQNRPKPKHRRRYRDEWDGRTRPSSPQSAIWRAHTMSYGKPNEKQLFEDKLRSYGYGYLAR